MGGDTLDNKLLDDLLEAQKILNKQPIPEKGRMVKIVDYDEKFKQMEELKDQEVVEEDVEELYEALAELTKLELEEDKENVKND